MATGVSLSELFSTSQDGETNADRDLSHDAAVDIATRDVLQTEAEYSAAAVMHPADHDLSHDSVVDVATHDVLQTQAKNTGAAILWGYKIFLGEQELMTATSLIAVLLGIHVIAISASVRSFGNLAGTCKSVSRKSLILCSCYTC